MNDIGKLFSLEGRKALVTGASSGLGRHFAMTLAKAGAEVAVAARRGDRLTTLVQQIESMGGKVMAVNMDVTDRASIVAALDQITGQLGTVDVLVNNAGVSNTKRPLDYSSEDWDAVLDTNLKGAWMVAQETARRLVAAKTGGSIVNITSILADRVAGGVGPYIAAKGGLKQLTQSLALELARYEIRVNCISPGYVITEINEDFLAGDGGEKMKARIPTRRFGRYEDLDGALLLLASQAGGHMTGTEIVVDGGHLISSL